MQAAYPGTFAVFFRWGPDALPTGGGFSWYDYNFVTMGGWDDMEHCGHSHWESLGHELGRLAQHRPGRRGWVLGGAAALRRQSIQFSLKKRV